MNRIVVLSRKFKFLNFLFLNFLGFILLFDALLTQLFSRIKNNKKITMLFSYLRHNYVIKKKSSPYIT